MKDCHTWTISGITGIGTDRTKASVLVMESADWGKQMRGSKRGARALGPSRVDVSPRTGFGFEASDGKCGMPITRARRY